MLRRAFLKVLGAVVGALSVRQVAEAQVAETPVRMRVVGEPLPYMMLHRFGGAPCGKPAALMPEIPPPGSMILPSQFRKLNGEFMSAQICGSCGGFFRPARQGIQEVR